GAVSIDWFRDEGYLPAALMNFLALLGWSYDDRTTIMSRHELIERFTLERVVPSPATFDYKKLDWMNGMYLRGLQPDEYAHFLERWLREHDIDWPQQRVWASAPIRLAVTGSKVSPGLFESLELLGRDESLRRLRAAAA